MGHFCLGQEREEEEKGLERSIVSLYVECANFFLYYKSIIVKYESIVSDGTRETK